MRKVMAGNEFRIASTVRTQLENWIITNKILRSQLNKLQQN